MESKTYNTEDSQVVTDPSTNSALCCLYMGERTGSLVFSRIWSYVTESLIMIHYIQTFLSVKPETLLITRVAFPAGLKLMANNRYFG